MVRDEKILLLAKEFGDQRDILNAIKQVIINCCQDPTVDVNKLSITDLEYIFLKLHAASVSNVAKITIYDPEDDKRYPFDIDLNKVEVDDSKQKDANVKLSENLAVHLNYLPASLYGDKAMTESKDPVFDTVVHCMDKIYQGDTVFETKNETKEEERPAACRDRGERAACRAPRNLPVGVAGLEIQRVAADDAEEDAVAIQPDRAEHALRGYPPRTRELLEHPAQIIVPHAHGLL